ncbi:MAG: hypothetical protein HQL17_06390 [Candidatus Omnitrophica bacterium]|nr:hypothetical protein [Candidatus Omnitrophota bacterium]
MLGRIFCGGCIFVAGVAAASAESKASVEITPAVKVVEVKGDVAKFRAISGQNDQGSSGFKDISIESDISKGTRITMKGGYLPEENDNNGTVLITQDDVGFIRMDYNALRRYYMNQGGYYPFTTAGLQVIRLTQDLNMDIDKFSFELGNGTPDDSTLSVQYDRRTKKGIKNRLTWGGVVSGLATKSTAPSYSEHDETTDTVTVKNKFQAMGFTVKGAQQYEFFQSNKSRTEQWYNAAMDTPASTNKKRVQSDDTQAKSLSTTLLADKWSLNDKTYLAVGSRYSHNRTSQIEVQREYQVDGTPWAYSRPYIKDGGADNFEDKYTLTGNLLSNLSDRLTFGTKFKTDMTSIRAASTQGADCGPADTVCSSIAAAGVSPDGVANYYYDGSTENKIMATAGSFSLKYSGIPKTSLYTDLDLTHERNWLSLARIAYLGQDASLATNTSGDAYHDIINRTADITSTVGARFTPVKNVTTTVEYKNGGKNDKLDRIIYSSDSEAYLNTLRTRKEEVASRIAWKPVKWFENSFRYKTIGKTYKTQYAALDMVKSQQMERDYIYDVTLIPTDALMFNVAYLLQLYKTSTPAAQMQTATYLPATTANVHTWSAGISYAPVQTLSFFNSYEYSRAKNANNDYIGDTGTAFLYAPDNEWYNTSLGVTWSPRKYLTIEPRYTYYGFRSYQSVDTGNYTAQALWLDVNVIW